MKKTDKVSIYCFSGTGNSVKVAGWMKEVAGERQLPCEITNIGSRPSVPPQKPESGELLVFTSPIHGFNYPPLMLKFLLRFPRGHNRVVLMNTRAGMLIGKFITPGVTGIAFYLAAFFLAIKGYRIQALKAVDMPSNWVSLHPGLNQPTVLYLHQRNIERVKRFASKIYDGKRFFRCLLEVYDLLLLPVAAGYYFIGRFFLAKTFVASADCNQCGKCLEACPVKAIRMVDNRPFWTLSCESCMHCMSYCPVKAIETNHGVIAVFVLGCNLLTVWLLSQIPVVAQWSSELPLLMWLGKYLVLLLLFSAWYFLIHHLMRFRVIERMVVFTSLTHFRFWGRRYRALKKF